MEEIINKLYSLCENYHIIPPKMPDDLPLTVPVIGLMNAGKSSILNAVLGQRILPTPLISRLTVPFALHYGENEITVRRDGNIETASLNDLRSSQFDTVGVDFVNICLRNSFLAQLPELTILDTPCIDLCDASVFSDACAVMLVISAEEPAIKDNLVAFFRGLELSCRDLYVIVTKSDKVTSANLERTSEYLTQRIPSLLGIEPKALLFTDRRNQNISSVQELFLSVQANAEKEKNRRLAEHLNGVCGMAFTYITRALTTHTLTSSELEANYEHERRSRESCLMELKKYENSLSKLTKSYTEKIIKRVYRELSEHLSLLPQGDIRYADNVIAQSISGGFTSEMLPAINSYLSHAEDLLRVHELCSTDDILPDLLSLSRKLQKGDFNRFLALYSKQFKARYWLKPEDINAREKVKALVFEIINKYTAQLIEAVSNTVQLQISSRMKQLREIKKQCKSENSNIQAKTEELKAALNDIKQMRDRLNAIYKD